MYKFKKTYQYESLYIIAGSAQQAKYYAELLKLNRLDYRYVSTYTTIMGLMSIQYIKVGAYLELPEIDRIEECLKITKGGEDKKAMLEIEKLTK